MKYHIYKQLLKWVYYCDDQSCLHTLTFCWLLHVHYCVVAIIILLIIIIIIIIIIINSTVIARVLSPNFLLNKKLTFRTKLFGQLLRSLLHLLLFMIYHIHECNIHDKFNGKFFEWPFGTDKFCCDRCMLLGQVIKKKHLVCYFYIGLRYKPWEKTNCSKLQGILYLTSMTKFLAVTHFFKNR